MLAPEAELDVEKEPTVEEVDVVDELMFAKVTSEMTETVLPCAFATNISLVTGS